MRAPGALRFTLLASVLVICCSVPDYTFVPPMQARCDDGVLNGTETDLDCGGTCGPCQNGKLCRQASDCELGSCVNQVCQAPHCVDQMLDSGETDVDCGGPECPRCGVHQSCDVGSDCASNLCQGGDCVATGCDDEIVDGSETDLNCGGGTCPPCAVGQRCELGGDCVLGVCLDGICSTVTCGNGMQDPDEQGVDCGGSCPKPCDAAANCSNLRQTEDETDVDCGGGTCPRCANDLHCLVSADCTSDLCSDGVCSAPCTGSDCGAAGAGGTAGTAGSGGMAGDGGSGAIGGAGSAGTAGGAGSAGMLGGGGASGSGGMPQGGAGAGGSSGAGAGGGGTSGGGMGGSSAGSGGSAGMAILPEPTCSGCARLSVPLAASSDKANYAITLANEVDASSAVMTIRVYRQAGTGGQIKGYVQHSGSPDFLQLFQNTPVDLAAINGWQDVTWDIGAQQTSYDKTIVGRVGVQITADGAGTSWTNPTVVYVDSISVSTIGVGPWTFDSGSSIATTSATTGSANVLFCNSGDSPVSGSAVSFYSR